MRVKSRKLIAVTGATLAVQFMYYYIHSTYVLQWCFCNPNEYVSWTWHSFLIHCQLMALIKWLCYQRTKKSPSVRPFRLLSSDLSTTNFSDNSSYNTTGRNSSCLLMRCHLDFGRMKKWEIAYSVSVLSVGWDRTFLVVNLIISTMIIWNTCKISYTRYDIFPCKCDGSLTCNFLRINIVFLNVTYVSNLGPINNP